VTAEIAILNKTAVALAADSAVTISAGSSQEKIYDTADKLFELSDEIPIGVMINSDMNFMETPIPVLIKDYRGLRRCFNRVEEAATDFLTYLHQFGRSSPETIKAEHFRRTVTPIVERVQQRATESFVQRFPKVMEEGGNLDEVKDEVVSTQIEVMRQSLHSASPSDMIGGKIIRLNKRDEEVLNDVVQRQLTIANDAQKEALKTAIRENLHKGGLSRSTTGVVFAGFGRSELFPTLLAFQMEGILSDRLKFKRTYHVDIDRRGVGASVIPFAQREMVERFLYGLDGSIERQITQFCQSSVPKIREEILESLEMSDEDRAALNEKAKLAERVFFDGLAQESFAAIRQQSRSEIEGMVEFMPKPELAKMAEALVNLTSIKRRVSRGMETVGGAIDVAVISKSEGFIWVKRKHYFPEELNYRFFDRMRAQIARNGSKQHGQDLQSGAANA
jgi:hypothetical protein